MPYKVGDISRGPCCEINALIVQVVGEDHPPTQRLAFYEQTRQERLDAVTASDEPETVNAFFCAKSALHVWNWTGEPKHRLMLEVETEQGEPITLPLPETRITLRQLDQQWNQIVPVLPFVALPGVNSPHDPGTAVLCRAGYLYVFIAGALWRELEVRVTDEGSRYHDIELEKFRIGKEYADDARLATGKALDDIWLPANWNNVQVETQLCFSEVQLSAARLQRLESDAALRERRCQKPDLRVSVEGSAVFESRANGAQMLESFLALDVSEIADEEPAASLVRWTNLGKRAFPLTIPAPQRARQTGIEWMLDQPARYLCDLSGEFLESAFTAARQHVRKCEAGTTLYRPQSLEVGAWAQCLEHILQPDTQGNNGLWQAQPPTTDVLQAARSRSLYGVQLRDSQYRLRHLNTRIQDQRYLLELLGTRAQRYPHHGSALLVQQLIVPLKIGGKANPLHQKLDTLKQQGRLDINRFTASSERAQLWRQVQTSQLLLCIYLQRPEAEESLADHLSLDDFDYAAALYFVSQLFVTLAMGPKIFDPLAASGDITDAITGTSLYTLEASAGQQWIATVVNDPGHPLHAMLWPDAQQQNLDTPYQPAARPEVNEGKGHFRANELAKTEQNDYVPANDATTLDSLFLASLLKSNNLKNTLTVGAKAGAAALVAIHENLQGAIEAAERALHGAQHIALQEPDAKPFRLNQALHRRSLGQLRGMLPGAFGDLHYLSYADARQKDYYVFGLDDIPKKVTRTAQPYGVYYNEYGPMPIPAERDSFVGSVHELPAERIVLGIPRNHRTALAVSRVNQRFNTAWQDEMARQVDDKAARMGALEKAVKLRDTAQSSTLFRALDSVPVAAAIVGLELFNLVNELDGRSQTGREKGTGRVKLGVSGAIMDFAISIEALTVKLTTSNSILAVGRKTIFVIADDIAIKFLGSLSKHLLKSYSARIVGQFFAGSIFVGINLSDAWYSYKWGDDAYIGYSVMAVGGLIGTASTIIVGGGAFLGLTPLGWVALLVICIGAGLVYFLSSKPIEDWLLKGPFGDDHFEVANHLQDSQQAFYYLVSLFATIRIDIARNPDFISEAKIDCRDTVPYAIRKANTRIRIESNLGGLVGGLGELSTQAFLNLKSFEVLFDQYSERSRTRSSEKNITPVAQRLWPDALELFVHTPYSYKADLEQNLPEVYHVWRVRAQLSLSDGQTTWVFPAPPPKDPTPFGPAHAKPDFEEREKLFWADEFGNRAKGAQ